MIQKIFKNVKKIYLGVQFYLCKGLKFASIGTATTISAIGALAVTTIIVGGLAIETLLSLLYQISAYGETLAATKN